MIRLLVVAMLLAQSWAHAVPKSREGELGVGFMVGDTTSLTAKYWTETLAAVDISAGADSDREGWLQASYIWHLLDAPVIRRNLHSQLSPYGGIGLGLGFNRTLDNVKYQHDYFLRLPIGLAWLPPMVPVDVFAEVAPTFELNPTDIIYLSGNIGGRYYF